jgi:hypothetical protein
MSKSVRHRLSVVAALLAGVVGAGTKHAESLNNCPPACTGTCWISGTCVWDGCTSQIVPCGNPQLYQDRWWSRYEKGVDCSSGPDPCRAFLDESGYQTCGCSFI